MSDELWIVIPRWNDFQHPDTTRSGVMPWVKNFTRLLSDDHYLDLSLSQRGLLHSIWLEYARSRAALRASTNGTLTSLSRRLGVQVRAEQLVALNHAGFIQLSASRPASNLASRPASNLASTEEKREELQDQELTPSTNNGSLHADDDEFEDDETDEEARERLEAMADAILKDIPF